MHTSLLILNAGSSSLKFATYQCDDANTLSVEYRGSIEAIGPGARLLVSRTPNAGEQFESALALTDHEQALQHVLDWLEARHPGRLFRAAGHRVVHGGNQFSQPVRIDARTLTALAALIPLSPLHQPHNLAAIQALARLRPELTQVACFDTAFHHTLPAVAQRLALPRKLHDRGLRRYGFHGLSYEYIASVLPDYLGKGAEGRIIVAHLGNGASLCAMKNRRSLETSMSFTPLDGLPMGTRCGALDPGVLLYLQREAGMSLDQVDTLLNRESGLLGVSGLSADVRELQASEEASAREALALFAYRTGQAIASHAVALGGIDALVFTAGIGEHAIDMRAEICQHLAWLGIRLDKQFNQHHGPRISAEHSPVSAWVIPTNEEQVIARHAWALSAGCPALDKHDAIPGLGKPKPAARPISPAQTRFPG